MELGNVPKFGLFLPISRAREYYFHDTYFFNRSKSGLLSYIRTTCQQLANIHERCTLCGKNKIIKVYKVYENTKSSI